MKPYKIVQRHCSSMFLRYSNIIERFNVMPLEVLYSVISVLLDSAGNLIFFEEWYFQCWFGVSNNESVISSNTLENKIIMFVYIHIFPRSLQKCVNTVCLNYP